MTTARLALLLGLVLAAGALGCAPQRLYVTMSSHTIEVADHQTADILWLQDNSGSLYRCSNGPDGPRCVQSKTK